MQLLMSDEFFKRWEITKFESTGKHYIVIDEEKANFNSTIYLLKELNISKWWLTRRIQLWAIKKAFKD